MRHTTVAVLALLLATAALSAASGPIGRTTAALTGSTTTGANSLTNLVVSAPSLSAPTSGASGLVSLGWSASPTAALAPLTYTVLRRPSGGSYATVASSLTSLSFSETPPADGSYDYTVQAVVSTFTAASAARAGLSDRTAPVPSISCDGTVCSSGWYGADVSVSVSATDGGAGVASVTQSVDGAASTTTTGSATTFTVSGSAAHSVAYSATDAVGNVSTTVTSTIRIDTIAPTAATGLAAASGTAAGTVSLTWSAASDAHSGVAGYDVRYVQAGNCSSATYSLSVSVGNVAATTVSGLTSGKSYCFRLVTRDGAGNTSAASGTASAKAK